MKAYPNVICAEELELTMARGCQVPDCEHGDKHDKLTLVQQCHPGEGLKVTAYAKEVGEIGRPVLRLQCRTCDKDVAAIVVGKDSE